MEGYILVRKGNTETRILAKNKNNYLSNGWELVTQEVKEKPSDYNDYTVIQLRAICKNRNILVKKDDRKQVMIDKLIKQDDDSSKVNHAPSNKGFTDNLIIE